MTVLSTEHPPAGLMRCISTAAQAEQELDRIATRTIGATQRDAELRVQEILEQVKREGDQALISLTEKFDGFRPEPLRIDPGLLEQAWKDTPINLRDALDLAHRRIQDFHQRQRPTDLSVSGVHGEQIGRRWRPVHAAGLYIPGGRAAYPSTVLMNAVPAKAAGVKRIAMVTPAGANGLINTTVLAAAHMAGIREVYRVGGAQAIAALVYGM